MEISGIIKVINPEQQVSSSYRKRELVLTTEEQYPQHILIEFGQDKCDLLNYFKPGQAVTVGINLRGREWTNPQGETKYFNSIQGWRIQKAEQQPTPQHEKIAGQFEPAPSFNEEDHDDLPF